jgi:nucleoside-diphosphate-sugar epimerase
MKVDQILITGASGHVGSLLVRALLPEGRKLKLLLNAQDARQFERKRSALEQSLLISGLTERDLASLTYVGGDLSYHCAFDEVEGTSISTIVHLASQTKFNQSKEVAENVNIGGTERVLDFARRCPNLENIILVSSIYASGLKEGQVEEHPLCATDFGNHYEWSKWQTEQMLVERYSSLPWQIVRLATVIADDVEGTVTHQNAFHQTLKLFYYGLLSILPGNPATPLYFISGKLATDALKATIDHPHRHRIYNVSPSIDGAIALSDLIDVSFACFKRSPDFARRNTMPPLYSEFAAFELMAEASSGFRDEVLKQALAGIQPFARQLFVRKEILNLQTVALLGAQPISRDLIEGSVTRLVETKWGRA